MMAWASRALGTCTYVSPQESETRFTSPIPVLKLKTSFPSRLESIRTCHPRGHSRHQRQSEAIRGGAPAIRGVIRAIRANQRQSEVVHCHPRPSEAIRGLSCPSVSISVHQCPSEVIRGTQRHSEALRGTQRHSEGNQWLESAHRAVGRAHKQRVPVWSAVHARDVPSRLRHHVHALACLRVPCIQLTVPDGRTRSRSGTVHSGIQPAGRCAESIGKCHHLVRHLELAHGLAAFVIPQHDGSILATGGSQMLDSWVGHQAKHEVGVALESTLVRPRGRGRRCDRRRSGRCERGRLRRRSSGCS